MADDSEDSMEQLKDSGSGQVLLASASPRTPVSSYSVQWHCRTSLRHQVYAATGLLT